MRKINVLQILGTALLVASCGSTGTGGGGGNPLDTCAAGDILSADSSGKFVCKQLPGGAISLPRCDATTDALTANGKVISCTTRNTGGGGDEGAIITKLNMLDSKVNEYKTTLDGLGGGTGARATFVGITDTTTNGKITRAGSDTGLPAAHALCGDKYAGSHMCHIYEVYNATMPGGKLIAGTKVPKAWIYTPAWKGPTTAEDANGGLSDNCGTYTYPTGDKKWYGTAMQWDTLTTASYGLRIHNGSAGAPCSAALPIACCK